MAGLRQDRGSILTAPKNPVHGCALPERSEAIQYLTPVVNSTASASLIYRQHSRYHAQPHATQHARPGPGRRLRRGMAFLVGDLARVCLPLPLCPWCVCMPCVCLVDGAPAAGSSQWARGHVSYLSQGRRKPMIANGCQNPARIIQGQKRSSMRAAGWAEAQPAHLPAVGLAVPSPESAANYGGLSQ